MRIKKKSLLIEFDDSSGVSDQKTSIFLMWPQQNLVIQISLELKYGAQEKIVHCQISIIL